MPIHDVGYRSWLGNRMPRVHSFLIMVFSGIMITRRSAWIRRMLAAAWLPALYIGFGFYLVEQALQALDPGQRRMFVEMFGPVVGIPSRDLFEQGLTTGEIDRHRVWAALIAVFLAYPQSVASLLLTGLIAPPLISRDLRTRAYLIYFSKPISKWDYIGGKLTTVAAFLSLITLVPALAMILVGVLFAPDLSVVTEIWDLPIRILLASLVFIIPTSTIALMFSSLTHESRYAALGWFMFWVLGFAGWQMIRGGLVIGLSTIAQAQGEPVNPEELFLQVGDGPWSLFSLMSLYESLIRIQQWLLGARESMPIPQLIVIALLTWFSLAVISRRVTAPIRV